MDRDPLIFTLGACDRVVTLGMVVRVHAMARENGGDVGIKRKGQSLIIKDEPESGPMISLIRP